VRIIELNQAPPPQKRGVLKERKPPHEGGGGKVSEAPGSMKDVVGPITRKTPQRAQQTKETGKKTRELTGDVIPIRGETCTRVLTRGEQCLKVVKKKRARKTHPSEREERAATTEGQQTGNSRRKRLAENRIPGR